MNIGIVSLQFGVTATGGGGVHVQRITDEYTKAGYPVTVISMHTDRTLPGADLQSAFGMQYSVEGEGLVKVIRVLVERGLATPYEAASKEEEYTRIKKFCDLVIPYITSISSELDIVHLHGHHLVPGYLAYRLKDLEFTVVSTLHFLESTLREKADLEHFAMTDELFEKLVLWETLSSHADAVVAISPGQRSYYLKMLEEHTENYDIDAIDKKLFLISSGVEDESILSEKAIKSKWEQESQHYELLSYSRMDPSKGLHYSVKALPGLDQAVDRPVRLTVAGIPAEGYDKVLIAEKDKLANAGNCELIFFDAIASTQERNAFMDKFNVYFFPTLSEPFGITLIEAGARGLFVITTDSSGPNYILRKGKVVEHDWGYVSDFGVNVKRGADPETELVEHLIEAFKWMDANQQQALQMICNFRQEIIEKYTWAGVSRQYLEIYGK